MSPESKNEWFIWCPFKGWERGPYSAMVAPIKAQELADELGLPVDILRRSTTVTTGYVGTREPRPAVPGDAA